MSGFTMSAFVFMAWKQVVLTLASIKRVALLVGRSEGLVLATLPNPSVVGVILEIASLIIMVVFASEVIPDRLGA